MSTPARPIDSYEIIGKWDEIQDARSWYDKIPNINFPEAWDVKILPPYGGALVRFLVNGHTSVYLDGYDRLGFFGSPYWEVYPVDGDARRCRIEDVGELMELIEESLGPQFETLGF